MEKLKKTIATNMVKLRTQRGLTQLTVARAIGVSRSHYAKMEGGKLNIPAGILLRLAAYYGICADCFGSEQSDFRTGTATLNSKIASMELELDELRASLKKSDRLYQLLEEELVKRDMVLRSTRMSMMGK